MPDFGTIPRKAGGHYCSANMVSAHAGPAIEYCFEADDDGSFWAGNGEYESEVNFCPFCGEKSHKTQGANP